MSSRAAIAARLNALNPPPLDQVGLCYDGARTGYDRVGARVLRAYGRLSPARVAAGDYDTEIVAAYHSAAAVEFYYRSEKDYGN